MNDSGVDDICKREPWEFPDIKTYDLVWFFISLADYKYSKVLQGFCLQAKNMAEYGSVTDLLKNKNPLKKDSKVSENPNPILSSIWNELGGKKSEGFLQFLASLKSSSSSSDVTLVKTQEKLVGLSMETS